MKTSLFLLVAVGIAIFTFNKANQSSLPDFYYTPINNISQDMGKDMPSSQLFNAVYDESKGSYGYANGNSSNFLLAASYSSTADCHIFTKPKPIYKCFSFWFVMGSILASSISIFFRNKIKALFVKFIFVEE